MTKQSVTKPRRVRVFAENWPTLMLFVAMATQWRRAGMAGMPAGLDYAALPVVAAALGMTLDAELLARLRAMEDAYISAVLAKA